MDNLKKPLRCPAGVGYVVICKAVSFVTKRYIVTASDVDREKIARIREGIPHAESAMGYSRTLAGIRQCVNL
jgi:UDP-N-acetyl-D-mannosaminuronate dehydrogenase